MGKLRKLYSMRILSRIAGKITAKQCWYNEHRWFEGNIGFIWREHHGRWSSEKMMFDRKIIDRFRDSLWISLKPILVLAWDNGTTKLAQHVGLKQHSTGMLLQHWHFLHIGMSPTEREFHQNPQMRTQTNLELPLHIPWMCLKWGIQYDMVHSWWESDVSLSFKCVSGWCFEPLWKIWKSVGFTIPNIWKNNPVMFQSPATRFHQLMPLRFLANTYSIEAA